MVTTNASANKPTYNLTLEYMGGQTKLGNILLGLFHYTNQTTTKILNQRSEVYIGSATLASQVEFNHIQT